MRALRAISLWQPYATAMSKGLKAIETRSWPTGYRGDLVICSAKRRPTPQEIPDPAVYRVAMAMPYGCAVCVVELYDCMRTERISPLTHQERELGDYTPGRFGWLTRNLRPLKEPVPVIGRQGLWILPEDVTDQIIAQLP